MIIIYASFFYKIQFIHKKDIDFFFNNLYSTKAFINNAWATSSVGRATPF